MEAKTLRATRGWKSIDDGTRAKVTKRGRIVFADSMSFEYWQQDSGNWVKKLVGSGTLTVELHPHRIAALNLIASGST